MSTVEENIINAEFRSRLTKAIQRGATTVTSIFAVKGVNDEILEVEDNRFLDFSVGITALSAVENPKTGQKCSGTEEVKIPFF